MSKKKKSLNNLFRSASESSENISQLHQKPPLPNNRRSKRRGSTPVLSSITNLTRNSFTRKKSKFDEMGSICIKGSALSPRFNPSPSKKCVSKVSPSHTDVNDVPNKGLNESKVMFYKSDISIDPVADITNHAGIYNDIEELDAYPEVFEEPDATATVLSVPYKSKESVTTDSAVNITNNNVESKLPLEQIFTNKQKSLPDLRSHATPSKSKRFSQGDTLKSSMGSANLLEIKKSFVAKRTRSSENKFHKSTSEHAISVEKRRKRLPTVENGIHVLEEGQVNYYEVLEEIGRGSFGSVCKCKSHKDNSYYAMKMISKKRLMRKNRQLARKPGSKADPLEPLYREVAILKKMDHPNVVKLIEVIDDIQIDNFYMIFELMTNGVVIDIPTENVIPEDRARQLFRELLLGIEYLHYSKIIHRDIKPSNLLLDDNDQLKIADFGVSNIFEGDDDLLNKYAGSPAFQSPEVLNYESRDKYSGKAVDVWAMGITLYCFLYGKCPFFSNNFGELSNMIKNDLVLFPDIPILNPQVFDLISRMLSKESKDRISINEIKEHPWVTEGGNYPLPSTEDNCTVIEVTDEEVRNSIKTKISKLSSLVVAKSILKGKSFLKGRASKKSS